MKVLLITSSDERCGIAEYGKNLICNLPDIEWTVIGHREIHSAEALIRGEFDAVHLNYQPGFKSAMTAKSLARCSIAMFYDLEYYSLSVIERILRESGMLLAGGVLVMLFGLLTTGKK